MHGSYRRVVFATFGWLALVGAQGPQPKAQAEKSKAGGEVARARPAVPSPSVQPVETLQRPILERPCDYGEEKRESDLCAQWKAADSAAQAAKWAKWSFFLGALGTLGLFWTLFYTRQAVRLATDTAREAGEAIAIAGRNADAAMDAVNIAREGLTLSERIGQAQVKAYLVLHGVTGRIDEDGRPHFIFRVTNAGNSPAFSVYIDWAARLELVAIRDNNGFQPSSHYDLNEMFTTLDAIAVHETIMKEVEYGNIFTPSVHATSINKASILRLYVKLRYKDVFRETREEKFLLWRGSNPCESFIEFDAITPVPA